MQKQGSSILFSSHRMEHVEELCQHICIMHKGVPVVQVTLPKLKVILVKERCNRWRS